MYACTYTNTYIKDCRSKTCANHTVFFHAIVSITSQHNYSKHNFIIIIYNYHFNTRLLTSMLALRCICQLNILIAQMFNYSIYNCLHLIWRKGQKGFVQGNLQNAYIYIHLDCICSISTIAFLLLSSIDD